MSTKVRKTHFLVAIIATAINAIVDRVGAGSSPHIDQTEDLVDAPVASDLASSVFLANNIMVRYLAHLADVLPHKAAMALPALVEATDLASAITLANAIKASYTTHIGSTTYHYTADSTNTIAASNATDQTSLNTLLNELRTDMNAHLAAAPVGHAKIRVTSV